jgi:hypothetical protein
LWAANKADCVPNTGRWTANKAYSAAKPILWPANINETLRLALEMRGGLAKPKRAAGRPRTKRSA